MEGPLMSTEQTTSLLRPLVEDLHARREQIRLGGGQEKIDKQHEKGALTARERIALLVDTRARRSRSSSWASTASPTPPSARWTASTRPPTASSPATARWTAA